MTNQELINKLKELPEGKEVVFFANRDIYFDDYKWNECFIKDIKETLYIEWNEQIFFSEDDLREHIMDVDYEIVGDIVGYDKKEVILITLDIS